MQLSVCFTVAACVAFLGAFAHPAPAQHTLTSLVNFNRIPASGTTGPAGVYPTRITVTGVRRPIASIRVSIPNLSHTYPDDLDIVLLSPHGFAVVLLSDAGGSTDFDGALTFASGAPAAPDNAPLIAGSTYSPTNHEPGDTLPLPSLIYTTLDGLVGRDPNGDWQLYVFDDGVNDEGSMGTTSIIINESSTGPITLDFNREENILLEDQFNTTFTIPASAINGSVRDLTVRLFGLTHSYPADLDITLTGPDGQAFILMSDVGGSTPVNDLDIHIAPSGPAMSLTSLTSGRYRATDNDLDGSSDLDGILGLSAADGRSLRGTWTLRIRDDAAGDSGFFRGWSLTFTPPCPGDFNASGGITVQDIFDFLLAYFASCP